VADTGNQRILHVSTAGELLNQWGEPSVEGALAMPGTFSEPWGIAVGPDGMVYVSDTWNHRVQKFTPDGEFIQSWGYFGQAQDLLALWGPRGIAVDDQGRVFLADTGNKRVVVFDSEGEPLSVIDLRFNEPVGVAIGPEGVVVVADTWNQRLVVARELAENIFTLSAEWSVDAWFGQSLNNKPYVSVSPEGQVFISDPEGYRIIQFNLLGEFVRTWGSFGSALDRFVLPAGLVADDLDGVWVVDSGANRLMYFRPPEE
jgi:DNA-binding beta-propeller fold protein YncE